MSLNDSDTQPPDLWRVVAITATVLITAAVGVLAYLLLDVLLLLFLGIVVAAAVQPWHVHLCRRGIPKGLALVLVFLPFLLALAGICFIVGPTLVEQVATFANAVPDGYENFRTGLRESGSRLLRIVGTRLPSFDALTRSAPSMSPEVFQGALQLTVGVAAVFAYLLTVIAIAFYWTLELPRIERMVASFFPVARRARVLTIWHEIESTLGAFIRGQGVLMLSIAIASGIGYALIGLPNVLMLATLAGLLEVVPVIGPLLAAVPAVLVALPMGLPTVALTVGLATLMQALENNILLPRIMSRATGTSALVGLLAVIAFGVLYGVMGVFIAIPVTAVAQVLLDRMLIEPEPVAESATPAQAPHAALRARLQTMQRQVQQRLRQRGTRMGIDPGTADHLVDALDQQIEAAIERVESALAPQGRDASGAAVLQNDALLAALESATARLERALERMNDDTPAPDDTHSNRDPEAVASAMAGAKRHVDAMVDHVDTAIAAAEVPPSEAAKRKPH